MINITAKYDSIVSRVREITVVELRDMMLKILANHENEYKTCNCGKGHHSYDGGLAVHLSGVLEIVLNIYEMYKDIGLDRNLLIAGAILHDIGKVPNNYSRLDEQFIGHETYGAIIVSRYLEESSLSDGYKRQLLGCVVSHMKELRDQNFRANLYMIEEFIIHQADTLDAYISPLEGLYENASNGQLVEKTNFPRDLYKSYFE